MGNIYRNSYIFIMDEKDNAHFVMDYYFASLGCAYRSNIYLKNKRYCVFDDICTGELETEGEYLPNARKEEWEGFFRAGPSDRVAAILAAAGLANIPVSKVVYFETEYVRSGMSKAAGFIASAGGVSEMDPEFIAEIVTFAGSASDDIAVQYEILERRIAAELRIP